MLWVLLLSPVDGGQQAEHKRGGGQPQQLWMAGVVECSYQAGCATRETSDRREPGTIKHIISHLVFVMWNVCLCVCACVVLVVVLVVESCSCSEKVAVAGAPCGRLYSYLESANETSVSSSWSVFARVRLFGECDRFLVPDDRPGCAAAVTHVVVGACLWSVNESYQPPTEATPALGGVRRRGRGGEGARLTPPHRPVSQLFVPGRAAHGGTSTSTAQLVPWLDPTPVPRARRLQCVAIGHTEAELSTIHKYFTGVKFGR